MADIVIKQIEEGMTGRQVADLLYSNFLALAGAIGSGGGGDIPTADIEKGVTAYGWGDHRQAGYLKGITGGMVTGALGYTPMDEAAWTKANIKATLGIADWALAAKKPTYTTKEVAEDGNLYFTDARAVAALAGVTNALAGDIGVLQGYFTNGVAKSAAKLQTARKLWGQSFDGTADVTGALTGVTDITASGVLTIGKIKIGDGVIEWDAANGGFKVTGGLWATDYLSSKGVNTGASGGGGGGSSYQRLDTWDGYTSAKDGWVLSAKLGYGLKTTQDDILRQLADISGQGTNVTFTPALTSGTQIGTLTIDGEPVKIYAPTIPTSLKNPYSLTINNSGGTAQVSYNGSAAKSLTLTKAMVGLGSVENTALSTWAGTNKITTLGTITTGVWNGTKIANSYLAKSAITIAGTSVSLGGSITAATLQSNLGLGTFAYKSSLAFADLTNKPTTISGYGITDAIGQHLDVSQILDANSVQNNHITHGSKWSNVPNSKISSLLDLTYSADWRFQLLAQGGGRKLYSRFYYNGNTWSDWAELVTSLNYTNYTYSKSTIDTKLGGYLPLSGGTIKSSSGGALAIDRTGGGESYIKLLSGGTYKGAVTVGNATYGAAIYNSTCAKYLGVKDDGTPHYHGNTLIHSGNIGSQSVARAKILVTDSGSSMVYTTDSTFYIGDNIYTTKSTHILGNDVRLRYGASASVGLILNSSGNVGIGTTSPQYKLDVNGTLHASGTVSFDSLLSVGGTALINGNAAIGGNSDGNRLYVYGVVRSAAYNAIGNNNAAFIFDKPGSNYTGIGANGVADTIYFGACNTSGAWVTDYYQKWHFNGEVHATTGIWSDGYVSAKGQNTSSDMRLKRVLEEVTLSVDEIAAAPAVRFAWKGGAGVDVGTSAQYWEKVLPDVVKRDDAGWLTMQYGNAAMVAVIALARRVKELEEKLKIKN